MSFVGWDAYYADPRTALSLRESGAPFFFMPGLRNCKTRPREVSISRAPGPPQTARFPFFQTRSDPTRDINLAFGPTREPRAGPRQSAVSPFGLGVYGQKQHECDVFKLLGLSETYLVPSS